VPADSDWPPGEVYVTLSSDPSGFSSADQLTLIRYVRAAGEGVKQEGWPTFCKDCAIPLIKRLQPTEPADKFWSWLDRVAERHPILGGAIAGLLFPVFIVLSASAKAWWTLATIIGISAVVNIRWAWGEWIAPHTENCLRAVIFMLCAGLVSWAAPWFSWSPSWSPKRTNKLPSFASIASLAAALIGLPLLKNGMVQGWVPLTELQAITIAVLVGLLLAIGYADHVNRKKRKKAPLTEALEADAVRRWDHYVKAGPLPDAGPIRPAEVESDGAPDPSDRPS